MNQPIFNAEMLEQAQNEATKIIASGMQTTAGQIWYLYWRQILILLFIIAFLKIVAGRIGSLIYNIIFLGILSIAIAVYGFELLFNPYFDIIYLLFYKFSYFLTGRVLAKIRPQYPLR